MCSSLASSRAKNDMQNEQSRLDSAKNLFFITLPFLRLNCKILLLNKYEISIKTSENRTFQCGFAFLVIFIVVGFVVFIDKFQ